MKNNILGPDAIEWLGVHYKTLLTSDETNGAMSIVDSVSPPQSGPPRHVHQDADETFVMLTGECEFWVDGATSYRGAGETVFVPRGTEHTFRVIGSQPSRHLVILTPGGFENFFLEMARGQYAIPEDMERITEVATRHHLTFTGPPLSDPA
jgi:quercetin dioxygenase-like cupin family protein